METVDVQSSIDCGCRKGKIPPVYLAPNLASHPPNQFDGPPIKTSGTFYTDTDSSTGRHDRLRNSSPECHNILLDRYHDGDESVDKPHPSKEQAIAEKTEDGNSRAERGADEEGS